MSTGQLHRPAVFSLSSLILVVAAALVLIAGCGGQEESEPPAQSSLPGMVPARGDSNATGTLRAAAGDSQGPGTSLTTGVQDSIAAEKAALRPTAPESQTGATAAARSPFHRPQVRSGEGSFGLQLGSFRSVENAQAQAERLRKLGYKPVLEVASLGGQTYHRVVLRGLPDRAEAERLGEHIRSQTGITYLIRQK
jgi:cell division septation protein DedD